MKVTGVLQTVALLATLGHISLVSVWTASMRGMTAVRSVTKKLTLIMVWLAERTNHLFRPFRKMVQLCVFLCPQTQLL